MKIYERDGAGALANRPRGRPKGVGSRLEPRQKALVAKTLRDTMPDELKLPSDLWTREAVVDLVERRFGVRISKWTAGRYLKEWGLKPGEPVRRAQAPEPR